MPCDSAEGETPTVAAAAFQVGSVTAATRYSSWLVVTFASFIAAYLK
jgi:hypothetical protein